MNFRILASYIASQSPETSFFHERKTDMNLKILPGFIAFVLLITFNLKRYSRRSRNEEKDFWARESQANSVRRKSLDGLKYIHIPLETFPTHLLNDDTSVMECIDIIESLASQKIVNLTGRTNTDLKLEYGAANITELAQYDQNYTLLARTLQKWADSLTGAGYTEEAVVLMEFAMSTGTDVSRTYYQLAEYWAAKDNQEQIKHLVSAAEGLRSANKASIIRHLKNNYGQA